MSPRTAEIVITSPDTVAMEQRVVPFVAEAQGLAVRDVPSHQAALTMIADIARAEREVGDLFAEPKRAAHAAHRAVVDAEKKLLAPLASARGVLSGKCDTYEREQKRIAQAREAELEKQSRAKEEARREFDAAMAETQGEPEEAAAILEAPIAPVAVHVAPATASVGGVATQKRYSAEVVSMMALIRYVAEHPEWVSLLDPNMPSLNRLAVSMRENMNIPGVRAVVKTIRQVRT